MKIDILTLFPGMLKPMLAESILGRAIAAGLLDVRLTDIRDFTADRHRRVDDYPFGGGAGMVMAAQPIADAIAACDPDHRARRIYLSPRGRTLDQRIVEELAREERLLLLCGHYEGVDQRALDLCVDEELSIGDYVLTGGELGALVVVDAVARLVPGVLGSAESGEDESFTTGLLEYPQYTRPRRVPRTARAGRAARRQPCRHHCLAARTLARSDARAPARPAGRRTADRRGPRPARAHVVRRPRDRGARGARRRGAAGGHGGRGRLSQALVCRVRPRGKPQGRRSAPVSPGGGTPAGSGRHTRWALPRTTPEARRARSWKRI